ncbi:MAG TPA: response regulator transcription factor [Thermoanaerobaculia bacterium]
MAIRVFIADDHTMFREGLRRVLEDQPQIEVVGEAATGPETLSGARETRPDVVLLDLEMPGRGGFAVAEELKSANPALRVLVLTSYRDDEYAIRSLKAGAEGFLTKDRAAAEVVKAVRAVYAGGHYLPPELASSLAFRLGRDEDRPAHEVLSDREFQVLRLIAAGKSTSDIAKQLNLSVKTVSTYRSRIREKMNLDSTAAIVRYALKHGLAD